MSVATHKRWVLIVEDDAEIKNLFQEELKKEGFKVLASSTMQEAVRLLTNQKFDCIILDQHLERGAGDQIVSYIRRDKHEFNHATPVVVVSGELDAEIVQKIKASVQAFFVKPFNLGAVIGKIKSLCGVV